MLLVVLEMNYNSFVWFSLWRILGICFTFWPVPKITRRRSRSSLVCFGLMVDCLKACCNTGRAVSNKSNYISLKKKINKKQVGWISVNIMVIMDLLLVMVSGFFLFFLDIILTLSNFSIYVFCLDPAVCMYLGDLLLG